MNVTNLIGQKVNLLSKKGICDWFMTDNICTIVKVLDYDEVKDDYCQHYIVRTEKGEEKEIREVECVFSPDFSKPYLEDTISKFLGDNSVYAEVHTELSRKVVVIYISWGDWSHSHGYTRTLMNYLGYKQVSEEVTEDDGSDCYSAIHKYILA